MKNSFLRYFFFCAFLFLCVSFFIQKAFSQEKPKKKLKVGLVLTGGGAKGFSHIGALKQIEKAGISLDMIGGTSVGAIIGGMYASGYSPQQIEDIFLKVDNDFLISNTTPRKHHSIFSKKYDHLYFYELKIYKWGIQMPLALSKGQNAYNFLKQIFQHVDFMSFNKLNIPFYCIATDLETGKAKVFDKGNLPRCIRASASFPTLFEPVEIGNHVYIDGGITDNFPVEEMKKRGIDVIIAVDVQGKLYKKHAIKSFADLLNQIISYGMYKNDTTKKKQVDIYIRPDILEYGTTDFSNISEIIKKGTQAAQKKMPLLKAIAKKQNPTKKPLPKRKKMKNLKNKTYKIASFGHNFIKAYKTKYLLKKLQLELGDAITLSDWIQKLYKISSDDDFGLIKYDFIKMKKTNDYFLKLDITQRKNKNKIKFGLLYDPFYKAGFLVNLSLKSLLIEHDVLSLDVIFGDTPRGEFNYYVNNGFFFSYGYKLRYNHFENVIHNKRKNQTTNEVVSVFIPATFRNFSNLIYLEKTLHRKYSLQLGLEYTYKTAIPTYEQQDDKNLGGNYLSFVSSLQMDTYNRAYLPQSGFKWHTDFRIYKKYDKVKKPDNPVQISEDIVKDFEVDQIFMTLNSKMGFAYSLGNFTFFNELAAGFYFAGYQDFLHYYHIGGPYQYNFANFIPFYGLRFGQYVATNYFNISTQLRYQFFKKHDLSFELNNFSFTSVPAGNENGEEKKEDYFKDLAKNFRQNMSISYTYWSFLGPFSLIIAKDIAFFKLGYTF